MIIRKIMGRKAFLTNPKCQYRVSNEENMIVEPTTKRMKIITSIQVRIISWINFDYKENGGQKIFLCKSKASMSFIPM